jgi:hypothetical protein
MSDTTATTTATKDRIAVDLQKAKAEERTRAERIQTIVSEAFSQTIAEVKEGSVEIRAIAQDAVSATVEELKQKGKEVQQEVSKSFDISGEETVLKQQLSWLQQKFAILKAELTAWYAAPPEERKTKVETTVAAAKATFAEQKQTLRQRLKQLLQNFVAKL